MGDANGERQIKITTSSADAVEGARADAAAYSSAHFSCASIEKPAGSSGGLQWQLALRHLWRQNGMEKSVLPSSSWTSIEQSLNSSARPCFSSCKTLLA
jgi:hypothetical protein